MKKIIINNWIKAKEVRVVDTDGQQLGVFPLPEAVSLAKEKGYDLIQLTDKTDPPVCRIADYGKFSYQQQKKEKGNRSRPNETKGLRIKMATSSHDLEVKAKSAIKFLSKGHKVRIEMLLRGREKGMVGNAIEKMKEFLAFLENEVSIKVDREIKREGRGLVAIISKK